MSYANYGQAAEAAMESNNVRQDYILYDNLVIGSGVPSSVSGWFPTFTALAGHDGYHGFFDQRQESEVGSTYTNMKKKTGLDFPVIITDMGVEFHYPDPVNTELFDGDRAAAKVFQEIVPKHAYFDFFIGGGDHKILTAKPEHAPQAYGPQGNQVGGNLVSYASLMTNGTPHGSNCFHFANFPLRIPADKIISVRLNFAAKAKEYLNALVAPAPMAFSQPATEKVESWAMIGVWLRGTRDIQNLGDLRR